MFVGWCPVCCHFLAYIAVKWMPDRIKLCTFKGQLFELDRSDSQARWFSLSPEGQHFCHWTLTPAPAGGIVQGVVKGAYQNVTTHSSQTAKWFCFVLKKGDEGWGLEGLEVSQQSLWWIYKSLVPSCPRPYAPFLCCFCSAGWVAVTGSCPPPDHYSPDTSHPAAWCPPESHPRA